MKLFKAAIIVCLIFCLSFAGCADLGDNGGDEPDDPAKQEQPDKKPSEPDALSFDNSWADGVVDTISLVTGTKNNESLFMAYVGWAYGENDEHKGLLISNEKGNLWSADFAVTFKKDMEIKYLLPKRTPTEACWGITAFEVCDLNWNEVFHVARTHFDGQGQEKGPEYGTGYVYEAATDRYTTINQMATNTVDITNMLTRNGSKPFFINQQILTQNKILPNVTDTTPGKLVFKWSKNMLIIQASIYGVAGEQTIARVDGTLLESGYKLRIRREVPLTEPGLGSYNGPAHSALIMNINGISLDKAQL